jgi:hypothetical protein
MILDKKSAITLSGVSIDQAFGLLAVFELNSGDLETAREAYVALQYPEDISNTLDQINSRRLGGTITSQKLKQKNLTRNNKICQSAKDMLGLGRSTGEIVDAMAERYGKSRGQIYKILREQCERWPQYRGTG